MQQHETDTKIYTKFVELASLTANDREKLKFKRGFTDEIIDKCKLISGTESIVEHAVEKLKEEFKENELIESGILVKDENTATINRQLLEGRIIIPYINKNSEVYHIRPHKLGFKGKGIEIYTPSFSYNESDRIILTEGEFKAVAAYQLGFRSMAVPGVGSFGGKNFDRLTTQLSELKIKEIIIIFDRELKDDPKYPNFKTDFFKRYDTEYWTFIMAYRLQRAGFSTKIGLLPLQWLENNNKIDIDGALSQGKTEKDINEIVQTAIDCYQYVNTLNTAAKAVVLRKIKGFFHRGKPAKILEGKTGAERNRYIWIDIIKKKTKEEDEKDKSIAEEHRNPISNFIIRHEHTLYDSESCLRKVHFVNEYEEKSKSFYLKADQMHSPANFKKFCLDCGNFIWEGTQFHLDRLWEHVFMQDKGAIIYRPDLIGRIEGTKWLFKNCLIQNGNVINADKEKVFWQGQTGYILPHFSEDRMPVLSEIEKINLVDFLIFLHTNFGSLYTWLGVGFIIATLFSEEIFAKYRHFPILFVNGKYQAGKTTLVRWLMRLVGLEDNGKNITKTTDKGLMRSLASSSSLPIWLDEYRNNKVNASHIEAFRNIYDRQGYIRAEKSNDNQTISTEIRGTLILSGQDTPADTALFSRCILVFCSDKDRDEKFYNLLNENSPCFSYITRDIVKKYDELLPQVLDSIEKVYQLLFDLTADSRISENYAIVAGSLLALIQETAQDEAEEFLAWVCTKTKESKIQKEDEDMTNKFFDYLQILYSKKIINIEHLLKEDNILYIWFSGVFHEIQKEWNNSLAGEIFKENTLLELIRQEKYFVKGQEKGDMHRKYFNKKSRRRCIAICLDKVSESIRENA